jgi:CubicO group peptidase (beta-lactamase class C family)
MKIGKVVRNKKWMFFPVLFIIACIASVALAQDSPTVVPEAVGLSTERLNQIDALLKTDIENGTISGAVVLVARKGKIAYFKSFGMRDKEKGLPMEKDSVFRAYSMTKPLVGVAAAILLEEGKIVLNEPVSKYIPAFKDVKVAVYGKDDAGKITRTTVKPQTTMTLHHLLTHTSGIAYGWSVPKPFQKEYYGVGLKSDWTIAEQADALAKLPLQFNPGTKYMYSRSFDVMGRVLEVVSGMPLDKLLKKLIYEPLGMPDTGFNISESDLNRLVYMNPETFLYLDFSKPRINFSGGGGAVSTAMDFARFSQMLLNGGQLDGKRLLGPRTVAYISSDHLGALGNLAVRGYTPGVGYGGGFGFYTRIDAGRPPFLGNVGEFYKGGYAGTVFWVDPKEDLIAVLMVTAPAHRLRYRYLIKTLIYQAIME